MSPTISDFCVLIARTDDAKELHAMADDIANAPFTRAEIMDLLETINRKFGQLNARAAGVQQPRWK